MAKENKELIDAIAAAKKAGAKSALWKAVADALEIPTRKHAEVNVSRLAEFAKPDSTVVVPGKVLGAGSISYKISVAALSFSASAKKLIEKAGGKCVSIASLAASHPKGTDVILAK